jgi:hypothetical protein
MKNKRGQRLISAALTAVLMPGVAGSAEPARFEALSGLPFSENRPTPETAHTLRDELLFQRATQAYLWALPLINTLGMKVGSEKVFGAGYHVLPVWKKRLDAKTLVTTPNSDVIYAMGYVDLGKDGPLVFEAPPNLQGILLDAWQRPIPVDGGTFFGDVGLPGPDAGKGGKSFCSCRRATRERCRRIVSFTVLRPTTCLSSCGCSIKTPRTSRRP